MNGDSGQPRQREQTGLSLEVGVDNIGDQSNVSQQNGSEINIGANGNGELSNGQDSNGENGNGDDHEIVATNIGQAAAESSSRDDKQEIEDKEQSEQNGQIVLESEMKEPESQVDNACR